MFKNNNFCNLLDTNYLENNWLNILKINSNNKTTLKNLLIFLNKNNIEARPIWRLLHNQRKMKKYQSYKIIKANKILNTHICVPSGINITTEEIRKVYLNILKFKKLYNFN